MRVHWLVGKRLKGDSRFTLLRLESDKYIYGEGRSISFSIHPYLWKFWSAFRDVRITFLFLNIHYKWR